MTKEAKKSCKTETLSVEETESILDAAGGGTLGVRNRAMIALAWKTGLRVSEICSLKPADIDFKSKRIRVKEGKAVRQKDGTFKKTDDYSVFTETLVPYLQAWLSERNYHPEIEKNAPLFCTTSKRAGKALHRNYFYNRLQKLAEKAKITKKIHPHIFRRTCATQLLNRGLSLTDVQAQLRHTSNKSTLEYLKIAQKEQLADKMQQAGF